MYPYGAIGPVQFMWKPILDNNKVSHIEITVQLVTRRHPSIHVQLR